MKNNKTIKICFLIIDFVLLLVGIALIPFNLLVISFPEWIPAIFSVLSVIGIVAYLIIFETKLVTKIVLPMIIVLASATAALFPFLHPYWSSNTFRGILINYDESITYEQAKGDLDFAMHYLQKDHPMFLHGLTDEIKQGYEASVERLKNNDAITANDLRREIQSIINPMHDAHTTTSSYYPYDRYLKHFPNKIYNGFKVLSVNGITVNKIYDAAKQYTSYETEATISVNCDRLSFLDFYGITAPFTYVWKNSDGDEITEIYTENDFITTTEFNKIYSEYFPQTEEAPHDFVYYEIDDEKSLAVLTLTSCVYNQVYIDCVNKMFSEIREKGIQNVAVDLRDNGGGSSAVAKEFIKYLPIDSYLVGSSTARYGFITRTSGGTVTNIQQADLLFNGSVYILTNTSSFSAAMDFAMMIQDNELGKIIGEPSGNSPNSYTEIATFYLPNTGLYMQISTKKSNRANPEIKDDYIIPDYQCESREVFETLYSLL